MLLKKRKDQQRLLKLVWMKELEDLIWNFVEIQHSYSKFNRGCKHLYINMVTNVIIVINVTCYIWYVTYHKDESNVVYVRVLKCSTSFLNFLKLFNSSRIFLKFSGLFMKWRIFKWHWLIFDLGFRRNKKPFSVWLRRVQI